MYLFPILTVQKIIKKFNKSAELERMGEMFKVTFSGFFFADGIDLDEGRPAGVFVSNSHGPKNYKKI